MDKKYLQDLWNWSNGQDPTLQERYTFEDWTNKLQSEGQYRQKFYDWIETVDPTHSERRPYESWEGMVAGAQPTSKKKEESPLPSGQESSSLATQPEVPQGPSGSSSDVQTTEEEEAALKRAESDYTQVDLSGIDEQVAQEFDANNIKTKEIYTKSGMMEVPTVKGGGSKALNQAVEELVNQAREIKSEYAFKYQKELQKIMEASKKGELTDAEVSRQFRELSKKYTPKKVTRENILKRAAQIRRDELRDKRRYEAVEEKYETTLGVAKSVEQEEKEAAIANVKRKYDEHLLNFDSISSIVDEALPMAEYLVGKRKEDGLTEEEQEELDGYLSQLKNAGERLSANFSNIQEDIERAGELSLELDHFKRTHGRIARVGARISSFVTNIAAGVPGVLSIVSDFVAGATGEKDFEKLTEGLVEASESTRKYAEEISEGVSRRQQVEDIKNADDVADFVGQLFFENVPQIAINYITKGKAMPVIAIAEGGNKFAELYGDKETSRMQNYLAALATAGHTYASERVEFGAIQKAIPKRLAFSAFKKMGRDQFMKSLSKGMKKNVLQNIKNISKKTGNFAIVTNQEGISEVLDTMGSNAVEKYILNPGKDTDISIFDGVGEAYLSGAVVGGAMSVAPAIAAPLVSAVSNSNKEIMKNLDSLNKLRASLETAEEGNKKVIEGQIKAVEQRLEGLMQKSIRRYDYLNDKEKKEALDLYQQAIDIKEEYQRIEDDPNIEDKAKEDIISGLSNKYNEVVEKRNKLIEKADAAQKEGTTEAEFEESAQQEENIKRIEEIETALSEDDKAIEDTGKGSLTKEAREELQKELNQLKDEQQTLAREQGTPTTIEGSSLRDNIKKAIAKVFTKTDTRSFKNGKEMAAYAKEKYNQDISENEGARVFIKEDGSIEVLTNEELADDTSFGHEVWHPLLLKAFGDNQKRFKDFRDGINKTLRQNGFEDLADKLDEFASQYEEDEFRYEEYLAQLGGILTSANIDLKNLTPPQRSLLEQIKDLINSFAIELTGQPVFLEDATPADVLDFISTMSDMMARGEDISGFFKDGTKQQDVKTRPQIDPRLSEKGIDVDRKEKLPQKITPANETKVLSQVDNLLDKYPNALTDKKQWKELMSRVFSYKGPNGETLIPKFPTALSKMSTSVSEVLKELKKVSKKQRDLASSGLEGTKEIGNLYREGKMDETDTGLYFLWNIMSIGISPYPQESGFLRAVDNGIDYFIKKSANGEFLTGKEIEYDGKKIDSGLAEYFEWVNETLPKGVAGSGSKANLRSFGSAFLSKASTKIETGEFAGLTKMQALHKILSDKTTPTNKLRRKWLANLSGMSFNNKIFDFILLTTGRSDLFVIDRVRTEHFWDSEKLKKEADLKPTTSIYDGSELLFGKTKGAGYSKMLSDVSGMVFAELANRTMQPVVQEAYKKLGVSNSPDVGRFHWETWVASSSQEVSHGSIDAIVQRKNKGEITDAGIRQGKYGSWDFNFLYRKRIGKDFVYEFIDEDGNTYVFDDLSKVYEEISNQNTKKTYKDNSERFILKDKNGNIIKRKTQKIDNAWYDQKGVNKQKYFEFLKSEAKEVIPAPNVIEDQGVVIEKEPTEVKTRAQKWPTSLTQEQVDQKLKEAGIRTKTENDRFLEDEGKGNETQRNNIKTYDTFVGGILNSFGDDVRILDIGAGFGIGAMAAKKQNVADIYKTYEPFPSLSDGKWEKFSGTKKPNYTKESQVPKESADVIVSNAVLNVVPQDIRDGIVDLIGKSLAPGGKAYISVRGIKEEALAKALKNSKEGKGKNVFLSETEYYVPGVQGDYQKGFSPEELKAYVQDTLGNDYTVEVSKESFWKNSSSAPKVVVSKKGEGVITRAQKSKKPSVKSRIMLGIKGEFSNEEKKNLVASIKAQARATKGLVRGQKKVKANIKEALNDLFKKGTLTTRQMQAVFNRFANVDLMNNDSVVDFVEYMEKVFENAEKRVSTEEKKGLLALIKGQARATKKLMSAQKAITEEIKELQKKGNISTKQMVAVLRRLQEVDLSNPESVTKFVDYMARVFKDAEYYERVSSINRKRRAARKGAETKAGIADGLLPLLQKVFSVDARVIPADALDAYESLINQFSERSVVLTLGDIDALTKQAKKILKSIETELEKAEALAEIFDNYENKILDDEGKVQFIQTINDMVDNDSITADDADIMKKYKSTILGPKETDKRSEEEIEEERQEKIEQIKSFKEVFFSLPTLDERNVARKLFELIKTSAIEKLDLKDLNNLLKVIDNIENGFLPHYAQIINEKMDAINKGDMLAKASEKADLLPIEKAIAKVKAFIFKGGPTYKAIERNPLFFIDEIFKNFKGAPIFKSLFEPVSRAFSRYQSEINTISDKMDTALKAISKSYGRNPNKVQKSKQKIMAYLLQKEFQANPNSKEVNSAKAFLDETIKYIEENEEQKNYSERDLKNLKELRETLFSSEEVDLEAIFNTFNKAEKNAIGVIDQINSELSPKVSFTSTIIRGRKVGAINQYVHHNALVDKSAAENVTDISIADLFNRSMMPSTKAKNLEERTGKATPLVFDPFSSTQRGAKMLLMDYYLTEAIRTARRSLKYAETQVKGKKKRIVKAIEKALEQTLSNVLVNTYHDSTIFDDILSYIEQTGYRNMLGSIRRAPVELLSNLIYVAMYDPISFLDGVGKYRGIAMSKEGLDVMKNLRSQQIERLYPASKLSGRLIDSQTMSQASGIKPGRSLDAVTNAASIAYNYSLKQAKNLAESTSDYLVSSPDKMIMKPLWFGSFAREFKKQTGQDVDFSKLSKNDEVYMTKYKDALDAATSKADESSMRVGASDNPFMGILKGSNLANQKPIVRVLNVFNKFMTKFLAVEFSTARTGLYALMGNGSISKRQGAAILGATMARMGIYSFYIGQTADIFKSLFGMDDEEEDEDTLLQKMGQATGSALTGLLLGRNFGNLFKAPINIGVEEVNKEFLDFLREGEYDPYENSLQYTVIPKDERKKGDAMEYIKAFSGAFGPAVTTAAKTIQIAAKSPKSPEAIERRMNELKIRVPLEISGNLGFLPLYKDIRKITLDYLYKDLKKVKSSQKGSSTGKPKGMSLGKPVPIKLEK